MSVAPTDLERTAAASRARRPIWALAVVVVAVLVVVVALVVGLRGLAADPVKGTAPDGSTILEGTYHPRSCCPAQGYIQAGARSVFVFFPAGCSAPQANSDITVHGRLDPSQGKATYQAAACASPR